MSSRIPEVARAEADAAEAEDPATDGEPEAPQTPASPEEPQPSTEPPAGPQEPTQEPPEVPTDAQIEGRVKAWERERDRHFRELEKRDAQRYAESDVCVLCEGHGMFWAVIPEPHASIRRQAVVLALGGEAPLEYLDDPDTEACERCDASGKLRTGSKVPGQDTRVCTVCNGQGWRLHVNAAPPPPVFAPQVTAPQVFAGGGGTNGALDPWGRPIGHPHYGVAPASVGV